MGFTIVSWQLHLESLQSSYPQLQSPSYRSSSSSFFSSSFFLGGGGVWSRNGGVEICHGGEFAPVLGTTLSRYWYSKEGYWWCAIGEGSFIA